MEVFLYKCDLYLGGKGLVALNSSYWWWCIPCSSCESFLWSDALDASARIPWLKWAGMESWWMCKRRVLITSQSICIMATWFSGGCIESENIKCSSWPSWGRVDKQGKLPFKGTVREGKRSDILGLEDPFLAEAGKRRWSPENETT